MDTTERLETYYTINRLHQKQPTSMTQRERQRKRKFTMPESEVVAIGALCLVFIFPSLLHFLTAVCFV